jgi:serine/threonine protein kinase
MQAENKSTLRTFLVKASMSRHNLEDSTSALPDHFTAPYRGRNRNSISAVSEHAPSTQDVPALRRPSQTTREIRGPGLNTLGGRGLRSLFSASIPSFSSRSSRSSTRSVTLLSTVFGCVFDAFGRAFYWFFGPLLRLLGCAETWEMRNLLQDFVAEMRVLAKLRHPNITTVMGAVMDASCPMLVMENMEHGSLYDLLHNDTVVMEADLLMPMIRDIVQVCIYF